MKTANPLFALTRLTVIAMLAVALVTAVSAASTYKVLHNFTCSSDGCGVYGALTLDKQCNLYGATNGGGPSSGTVFQLTPNSDGSWAYSVLHSFVDYHHDGGAPNAGLIFDQASSLYGTAGYGGTYDEGTIFGLTPGPSGSWSDDTLYNFGTRSGDGSSPRAGLVIDQARNLYGVAGVAFFEVTPGSGGWTETTLYTFCTQPPCPDGVGVLDPLIWDSAGTLYGTTFEGGLYRHQCRTSGCGTVFRLEPGSGGMWDHHTLYRFGRPADDGAYPSSGVVFGKAGNLYGTTASGGKAKCVYGHDCGTVFRLMFTAGGWKESRLHNFLPGKNGNTPVGGVVFDQAGNIYGVTSVGGIGPCSGGCGVIYKLAAGAHGAWKYSVLHRFKGPDGVNPAGGLIFDDKGNLYGSTVAGGPSGQGVVFELTP